MTRETATVLFLAAACWFAVYGAYVAACHVIAAAQCSVGTVA